MRNGALWFFALLLFAVIAISGVHGCRGDDGDDDDDNVPICTDTDGDGYYIEVGCGIAADCDDNNVAVYPGAPEACDGIDNQCPGDAGFGAVDEGCLPQGTALIPSGCFYMGDSFAEGDPDELPVHLVCITSFRMDVREVINSEYKACVDQGGCSAPLHPHSLTRNPYYGDPAYDDYPVVWVGYNEAVAYCAWAGKRLPTEAEWEYAARGGLASKRFPNGDSMSCDDACYGRYNSASPCWDYGGLDNDTQRAGTYAPNGFGLYDMDGNVMEWINDYYQDIYYGVSPATDPPGPGSGTTRVIRGGGFHNSSTDFLRVADRDHDITTSYGVYRGFRCAGD